MAKQNNKRNNKKQVVHANTVKPYISSVQDEDNDVQLVYSFPYPEWKSFRIRSYTTH